MKAFDSKEFVAALNKKTNGKKHPNCPFCGGDKFVAMDSVATLFVGKDIGKVSIGSAVPAGAIICEKCGHIELFALGGLGLLPQKDEEQDG